MTLTSEEEKAILNLVVANIGNVIEVEEFDFSVKCADCSDEAIDVLNKLCEDPGITRIGGGCWISARYSVGKNTYEVSVYYYSRLELSKAF